MSRRPNRPPRRRPAQGNRGPSRGPARDTRPVFTPAASTFRQKVERRSLFVVAFLRHLPRAVPFLLVVGLVAGGLLVPGVAGAACLVVVAFLLTWLLYLSWPALPQPARLVRLTAVGIVLAGAVARVLEN